MKQIRSRHHVQMSHVCQSNVFNKTISEILLEHASHDHVIDIEKNMLSFESIYNLFMFELETLREYLNENLINDFIVLFVTNISFVFKSERDATLVDAIES